LALSDENIRIKKRLFLTATPKHYDIGKRDKDGEFKFVGMDDESVFGSRAHTLLFSDAVAKGIICPYKVIITLIDKRQIDDFSLQNGITVVDGDAVRSKWVASQIAVSTSIRHTSASKVITFHSRVRSAKEFASDEAHGVTKFIDGFDIFHVHGKQKSNERKDTITKFRYSKKSLITNARCLTEGVDVPAVDMVAFVDPRHSKIDIAQAVGRAMRKPRGGNKQVGYIVVPIYADDADEFSIDEAIKDEAFDDVALVLNSLLEQDNELVEIIRDLKEAKGRGDIFSLKQIEEKVEVIGPFVDLQSLASSIFLEIAERLGSSWDEFFGALNKFFVVNGHCRVPADFVDNGMNLGKWVSHQRSLRSKLSSDRLEKLNSLNFIWDALDEKWERGFKSIKSFKLREGHFRIPKGFLEDGVNINNWMHVQKRQRNVLSEDKIRRLDEIGFVWDPLQEKWNEGLIALLKFKKREGHCNVSTYHLEDGFELGAWVSIRRRLRQKNKLAADKISQLNDLGFSWDSFEEKWEVGFQALLIFKNREGNFDIPPKHIENGIKLYSWIISQRCNRLKLSEDRIRRLDEINFVWDPNQHKWESGFNALRKFKAREGTCDVPTFHDEDGFKLGYWVAHQRSKIASLSAENIRKLNELGFTWSIFDKKWDISFNALAKFKNREGHCSVPSSHLEDTIRLGNWVKIQRSSKHILSTDQLNRLNELGFDWQ
jgi:hypothetical protein